LQNGGAADAAGVFVGDSIESINGRLSAQLNHTEALAEITAGLALTLVIGRKPSPPLQHEQQPVYSLARASSAKSQTLDGDSSDSLYSGLPQTLSARATSHHQTDDMYAIMGDDLGGGVESESFYQDTPAAPEVGVPSFLVCRVANS
jgi:hypothetical protein